MWLSETTSRIYPKNRRNIDFVAGGEHVIGIIYFIVIVLANTIGAVSGMGGDVIIKPIFDFMSAHDVAATSFYAATAVFTMSVVSTTRQLTSGRKFNW